MGTFAYPGQVLLTGFPAGAFQTNCYVIAADEGRECIIVDPGQDAVEPLRELIAQHKLTPAAIVLTHGHFDHTWSVPTLLEEYDVPVYIHAEDQPMVADPLQWHGPGIQQIIAQSGEEAPVLDVVEKYVDGDRIEVDGVGLDVRHTPGHTLGSSILLLDHPQAKVMLSGDTLFNQGIGRTDLPGGDHETEMRSIVDVCLSYPDETVVLPGHGPQTQIGAERQSNPFILEYLRTR
ncbi:MBL fold metallo-hydrolase [Epidermidibacterium keratini]